MLEGMVLVLSKVMDQQESLRGMCKKSNRRRIRSKPWMQGPHFFQKQQKKERGGNSTDHFSSLQVYALHGVRLEILQGLL